MTDLRRGLERWFAVFGSFVATVDHTGCPRITTDDGPGFEQPMLTPGEYEIAVGNKPLEELSFDTFHGTW